MRDWSRGLLPKKKCWLCWLNSFLRVLVFVILWSKRLSLLKPFVSSRNLMISSTFSFCPLSYFTCELEPLYRLLDEIYYCYLLPGALWFVEVDCFELYYFATLITFYYILGSLLKVLLEAACWPPNFTGDRYTWLLLWSFFSGSLSSFLFELLKAFLFILSASSSEARWLAAGYVRAAEP